MAKHVDECLAWYAPRARAMDGRVRREGGLFLPGAPKDARPVAEKRCFLN
jgi:hypothetical protein